MVKVAEKHTFTDEPKYDLVSAKPFKSVYAIRDQSGEPIYSTIKYRRLCPNAENDGDHANDNNKKCILQ